MPAFLVAIGGALGGALRSAWSYLLRNPALLAIVILLVLAGVQTLRLGRVDRDLTATRASLATCTANTKSLRAAIDAQNAAVLAQAGADAKASTDAAAALQRARGGAATVAGKIAGLEAQKPGADPCKAAQLLIIGSLK
jgi:hypothetical protein